MARSARPSGRWLLTEAAAAVRMLELVGHAEQTRLEYDAEERRRRGVTFGELAAESLVYLEHKKGAKPSTLRDYHRWLSPGRVIGEAAAARRVC